jgi:NADH:ubiquinone oxidoreductase subunit 3 (subunit A)
MSYDLIAILVFILTGVALLGVTLLLSRLLQPRDPNPEKLTTYECGEPPVGQAWIQFNIRFYVMALVFVIFDVEVVFLFPWAVVFQKLGAFAFIEMMVFLGILLVGLAYVWRNHDIEWIKPLPGPPATDAAGHGAGAVRAGGPQDEGTA